MGRQAPGIWAIGSFPLALQQGSLALLAWLSQAVGDSGLALGGKEETLSQGRFKERLAKCQAPSPRTEALGSGEGPALSKPPTPQPPPGT